MMIEVLLSIAADLCSNAADAPSRGGQEFFSCPLASNIVDETLCCGPPGEQYCCADNSQDPPTFERVYDGW